MAATEGQAFHWTCTAKSSSGSSGTSSGIIKFQTGDTYASLYDEVVEVMKKWLKTDSVVVLHYGLHPNDL